MSKSKDQQSPQADPKDVAEGAALDHAAEAGTTQQFSLEDLKAKGLDPAVYGYTESAE